MLTPRQNLLYLTVKLLVIHFHFAGTRAQLPEQKRRLAEQYATAVSLWADVSVQRYWANTTLEQRWRFVLDATRIAKSTCYADLPGTWKHIQAAKNVPLHSKS